MQEIHLKQLYSGFLRDGLNILLCSSVLNIKTDRQPVSPEVRKTGSISIVYMVMRIA